MTVVLTKVLFSSTPSINSLPASSGFLLIYWRFSFPPQRYLTSVMPLMSVWHLHNSNGQTEACEEDPPPLSELLQLVISQASSCWVSKPILKRKLIIEMRGRSLLEMTLCTLGTIQVSALYWFSDLFLGHSGGATWRGTLQGLQCRGKGLRQWLEGVCVVKKTSGGSISVYNQCKKPISTSRILFPLFAFGKLYPSLLPLCLRSSGNKCEWNALRIAATSYQPIQASKKKKERVKVHGGWSCMTGPRLITSNNAPTAERGGKRSRSSPQAARDGQKKNIDTSSWTRKQSNHRWLQLHTHTKWLGSKSIAWTLWRWSHINPDVVITSHFVAMFLTDLSGKMEENKKKSLHTWSFFFFPKWVSIATCCSENHNLLTGSKREKGVGRKNEMLGEWITVGENAEDLKSQPAI